MNGSVGSHYLMGVAFWVLALLVAFGVIAANITLACVAILVVISNQCIETGERKKAELDRQKNKGCACKRLY